MTSFVGAHLASQPAIKALVSALELLPELADFTISDRPPNRRLLPGLQVGPVQQEPWSTSSSVGSKLTITLTLSSRTGSFEAVSTASDAILGLMAGPSLSLAHGTCVLQTASAVRLEHGSAQKLELATLTIMLLIDLGDAA